MFIQYLIELVINNIAPIGALGAAIGAFYAASQTNKAAQGHLLNSIFNEYSTEKMHDNNKILIDWKNSHTNDDPEYFIKAFKKKYNDESKQDEKFKKTNEARREMSYHCKKIIDLESNKLINKDVFNIL